MLDKSVYVVILAGGQGTRLWPISRIARPKQFLDLAGTGRSLLQETVRRALELAGSIHQVLVLTRQEHASQVRQQVPDLPPENLLVEPAGRNTAACLGLAAFHLSHSVIPDAVMLTLPVDHMFRDEQPWFKAVRTAIQAAAQTESLVAIGIKPTHPASTFGYLHLGEKTGLDLPLAVHAIRKFVEKPSKDLAQTFLESGQFLWNTGTYAWQVGVFLAALGEHAPDLFSGLKSLGNPPDADLLARVYPGFENIPVDVAVMEKASGVLGVHADFERIDVGSLESLPGLWQPDAHGNLGLGEFLAQDSRDNIVYSEDGLVTLVGVNDLIVIRAGGVILVCPRDQADEIRKVVAELTQRNLEEFL